MISVRFNTGTAHALNIACSCGIPMPFPFTNSADLMTRKYHSVEAANHALNNFGDKDLVITVPNFVFQAKNTQSTHFVYILEDDRKVDWLMDKVLGNHGSFYEAVLNEDDLMMLSIMGYDVFKTPTYDINQAIYYGVTEKILDMEYQILPYKRVDDMVIAAQYMKMLTLLRR